MAAATRGYMSPSTYGSADILARSDIDTAKSNKFFTPFGKGSTISTIEPQQTQKLASRSSNLDSLNTNMDGFFDFEPPTNIDIPYRDQFSTPGASGSPWNFLPLSPPDSASFSPEDQWALGFQRPSSIITNIDPAKTRAQYGQITPPNDDDDNASLLDYHHSNRQRPLHPLEPDSSPRKRKRNGSNTDNEHPSQPGKRTRKYARNVEAADAVNKPEDVKRSKFLERNRVAASKCRQKKKEWTQNLETRARELQKNNNMLRMDVESLRQEVLFLKAEMLKHNNCGCTQIQDFMKSNAGSGSFLDAQNNEGYLEREQSPVESMPDSAGSRRRSSLRDYDEEDNSPTADISEVSIVDDENALEALLSNSIHHETSEEGILKQVKG